MLIVALCRFYHFRPIIRFYRRCLSYRFSAMPVLTFLRRATPVYHFTILTIDVVCPTYIRIPHISPRMARRALYGIRKSGAHGGANVAGGGGGAVCLSTPRISDVQNRNSGTVWFPYSPPIHLLSTDASLVRVCGWVGGGWRPFGR